MNEGKRIKEIRERLGISQTELARRLGVSNSTVSIVESDRDGMTMDRIIRYAQALGVRIEDIVNDYDVDLVVEMKKEFEDRQMIENLAPNERIIIDRYRMLPEDKKTLFLGQILAYTERLMNNEEGGEL